MCNCSKCGSSRVVKNGLSAAKKPRFKCKNCQYQFVLNPQNKIVNETKRAAVRGLLLERIAQRGISRSLQVSRSWLKKFILAEYANMPSDMNIDQAALSFAYPEDDNLDEIVKKKLNLTDSLNILPSPSEQASWADFSAIDALLDDISNSFTITYEQWDTTPSPLEILTEQVTQDAVLQTISASKYADVLEFMRVEADEIWSFVGNKAQKAWIWLAMNKYNRQIIGFAVGDRSEKTAQAFLASLPANLSSKAKFCTDFLKTYNTIFTEQQHHKGGKDIGFVNHLERFNCTLRQRCSRLVRKSLSFSKSLEYHINAIRYFICHYNQTVIIQ